MNKNKNDKNGIPATFRPKTLSLKLVQRIVKKNSCFYTSDILKQHVIYTNQSGECNNNKKQKRKVNHTT